MGLFISVGELSVVVYLCRFIFTFSAQNCMCVFLLYSISQQAGFFFYQFCLDWLHIWLFLLEIFIIYLLFSIGPVIYVQISLLMPHSGGWHCNVEYHKLVYYRGDGGRKISLSAIRHLRWFQQVTRTNQIIVCPL